MLFIAILFDYEKVRNEVNTMYKGDIKHCLNKIWCVFSKKIIHLLFMQHFYFLTFESQIKRAVLIEILIRLLI